MAKWHWVGPPQTCSYKEDLSPAQMSAVRCISDSAQTWTNATDIQFAGFLSRRSRIWSARWRGWAALFCFLCGVCLAILGNKATANRSPFFKRCCIKSPVPTDGYASAIGLCKDSCLIAKERCSISRQLGRVLICGRPAKCKRFFEEGWHVVGCCHLSGL